MVISNQVLKDIITRVIKSEDYSLQIVNIIDDNFLEFMISFYKKIAHTKIQSDKIDIDCFNSAIINNEDLSSKDIAIYSGLNKKTINNMYRSQAKQIVLDASNDHFETLYGTIGKLVEREPNMDLTFKLNFNGKSVDLNFSESLLVINTLAVKRAALRGGMWSTVGKQVEKVLMITLCKLYKVNPQYYNAEPFVRNKKKDVDREVDFYLKNNGQQYRCEVKLMGQGNPESADAIIARDSKVFVADTLSKQNKAQCDQMDICWVACRDKDGYKRFKLALDKFNIPYTDYNGNLDEDIPKILDSLSRF